jgi:aldehyde:ferredoxin oxidoreductase
LIRNFIKVRNRITDVKDKPMPIKTELKILRVNLSTGDIQTEILDKHFYRLYPGGKALAGYYLLNEMPAHTDPFDPDNRLILANGLLTGSPVSTTTRYVVAGRSPLTYGVGSSEAGGYWGPELKQAGYEAIIITGRAESPVYLWIKDDAVEIRSAEDLWGRSTATVQATIRETLGDPKIRVLQTGIAGENLVRFAGLTNDLRHFNGRNGMGAVFGAKNLRAVAVRGSRRYHEMAHDPDGLRELGRKLARQVKDNPLSWDLQKRGTPGLVEPLNTSGMLPTRNFRQGAFEGVDDIKWEVYESELLIARRTCFACAVRCKREVQIDGKPSEYGGPEYETVAAFSSNCGISDLHVIAKANEICNAYMMDSISAGGTIAFAMECYEKGLITQADTGGVTLRFGNGDALLVMLEMIAKREGFGDILAEGSKRAAERIGGSALDYAQQVKGQELAMHEPRGKYNVGMGYALSEIGADHLVVTHDTSLVNPDSLPFRNAAPLGITQAEPARSLSEEKVRQYLILESWTSFENAVGYCFFGPGPRGFIPPDDVLASVNLASGWEMCIEDLLEIGERAVNMYRLFNMREGFSSEEDDLPKRFFEGLENGLLEGESIDRETFLNARASLYDLKGWDPETGVPKRARLEALGLGWAADLLAL